MERLSFPDFKANPKQIVLFEKQQNISENKTANMKLKVYIIPALQDNYIYILKNETHTAVVDPSEAAPVINFLNKKQWKLDFIFNTHHHYDHTGGNSELKKTWPCLVYGFEKDRHRLPEIDRTLKEEEEFFFGPTKIRTLFIPGHTLGHIAFYFIKEKYLFCGDTLFAMGCGRLFEGSPQQMYQSLDKIKQLPKETLIYCGHEYTEANGNFALSIDKSNFFLKKRMGKVKLLRKNLEPTVPFTLKEELETNPF